MDTLGARDGERIPQGRAPLAVFHIYFLTRADEVNSIMHVFRGDALGTSLQLATEIYSKCGSAISNCFTDSIPLLTTYVPALRHALARDPNNELTAAVELPARLKTTDPWFPEVQFWVA